LGVLAGECAGAAVGALAHLAGDETARAELGIDAAARALLFLTEGPTDPRAIRRILATPQEQPA
ncbi:MAG: diaminopropionate ammonia-lyase, partial [Thermoleophilaceae bacterium]